MKTLLWAKKVFIAAEISANHGGSLKRAIDLIRKAKACGADAVKFQLYSADSLTIDCENKYFQIRHPKWGGQTLYSLYKQAHTPFAWFKQLKKVADEEGIIFFATAFDKPGVDLLQGLRVPFHKIASFELVDLPLIEYAAKTKKLLILSTGMATVGEIRDAVDTARKSGTKDILLLKCVSSYPARPKEMNLKTIYDLSRKFHCPVGLSDHTLGTQVPVAAVALGACFIEKHFTLSRTLSTPDSFFSIEPAELKKLVEDVRLAESSIGEVHYGLTPDEKSSVTFRRSLFVVKDVKRNEKFSEENVRSIRPSHGLAPKHLKQVLGRKATCDIAAGTPLQWMMVNR
ncbi:MAG: pseudaminic acid synthase [Candidatus Omnitrophota bacterium]